MSFSSTSSSSSDEVNSIMEDFIVEDCIMRSSLSRRLELIEELLKRQTETRAYIDSSCENDSSTSAQTESLGLGSPAAMATSPPVKRRRTDHGGDRNDAIDISILQKLSPVVVFAHGAGAPSTSEWMIRWKARLEKALHAVEVVTFDYPYIADGKRRAPPKAEKLVDFHADVVRRTVAKYPGHPLILAGKSMGSRVSCMVASREDICASAIICLGYPLKGINGATRDEILVQLKVPIIFVQGSKDGLCPLDKLEAVRKKMKPLNELHVVEGGDHSFKILKKHLQAAGSTQEGAEDGAVQVTAAFVSKCLGQR